MYCIFNITGSTIITYTKLKYHKEKGTTFLLYVLLLSCTPSGLAAGIIQNKLSVHVNVSFISTEH